MVVLSFTTNFEIRTVLGHREYDRNKDAFKTYQDIIIVVQDKYL